jgi:hypothetical protein
LPPPQQQQQQQYQQPRGPPPPQQQRTIPQQQRAPAPQAQSARGSAPGGAVAVPIHDSAPVAAAAAAPKKSGFSMPSTFGSVFGIGGASSPAAAPMSADEELALREANLKAREAKMLAKEQEVEQREREVKALGLKVKNWPFRRMALYYHSIKDDIPATLQSMMKKLYATWFLTFLGLVWNVVTVMVYWGEADSDQGTVLCWFYMFIGIPGSWTMSVTNNKQHHRNANKTNKCNQASHVETATWKQDQWTQKDTICVCVRCSEGVCVLSDLLFSSLFVLLLFSLFPSLQVVHAFLQRCPF